MFSDRDSTSRAQASARKDSISATVTATVRK